MESEEITNIYNKLANLETHIINLILPIQSISSCLTNTPGFKKEFLDIERYICAFIDENLKKMRFFFAEVQQAHNRFLNDVKNLDIEELSSEIRYISMRQKEISLTLKKIQEEGITKNVILNMSVADEIIKLPKGKPGRKPKILKKHL